MIRVCYYEKRIILAAGLATVAACQETQQTVPTRARIAEQTQRAVTRDNVSAVVEAPRAHTPVEPDSGLRVNRGPSPLVSTNARPHEALILRSADGDLSRARAAFAHIFTHRPEADTFSAGLIDVTQGFQACRFMDMPRSFELDGTPRRTIANQRWWDSQRSSLPRAICQPDITHEMPLAVSIKPETDFAHVYANATREITVGNERIRKIVYVRREFTAAFEQTRLYRDLRARQNGEALVTYFINVLTTAIPAQESSWGNGETSTANAHGMWQLRDEVLDGVATHVNFRTVFGVHATRSHLDPENLGIASRAMALHLDIVYAHLSTHLGEHAATVLNNPRDVLLPALIGSFHHGQGTEVAMLNSGLNDPGIQALMARNDATEIRENLYLKMSELFFLRRQRTPANRRSPELQNYGPISVRYVPSSLTLHTLISMKENHPDISVTRAVELQEQYPHVPMRFIIAALDPSTTIESDSHNTTSPLTSNVRLPMREVAASHRFVSPGNHSQDQVAVTRWLLANDPQGQRYARGLATNRELIQAIGRETTRGWLLDTRAAQRIMTVFNTDAGSGVPETWRQVVRVDQLPVLTEIGLAINEALYAAGMSREYFVVAEINGGVRSKARNRELGSSSPTSAHLGFSAFDFSINEYTVYQLNNNGNVRRFVSTTNLEKFRAALQIATARLAQEGRLFVRFHDGHFHVVPRVSTR